MRITAIRGRNLASLESFDVDFDADPLAQTRLFSIVGPTGAGKSTLLDALCLALFDRVPRLVDVREGAASDGDLSPRDPRGVLRRGAGEGLAEVDFVGRDGERYRARWEVWRARGRRDGRIQSQRVRFFGLDPERELSGKHKTETLDAIASALGLGFDEFRRSVLLAQGDFAAFLKARPEERAALLERMTATEIFSRISAAAYRHARELEAEAERLQAAAATIIVASDDERAQWTRERAERVATLEPLQAAHERTQAEWARAEARARLQRSVEEAQGELAAATEAWAAEAETRARLDVSARAEKLRPLWVAERDARGAAERAQAEVEAATARRADVARRLKAAVDASSRARKESERASEARSRAQPELDLARELDATIREADEAAAGLRAELQAARERLEAAIVARQRTREVADRATEDHAAAQALLRASQHAEPVEARWEDLRVELDRVHRATVQDAEAQARIASLEPDRAERARASDLGRAARAEAESHRDRLRATSLKAIEAVEQHRKAHGSPRELTEALSRLARAIANVSELQRAVEDAEPRRRALRRAEREAERQRRALKKARADLRRVVRRDRQLEGEEAQLSGQLRLALLKRDLTAHRHELLAEQEACPLCGAPAEARSSAGPGGADAGAPKSAGSAEKRIERIAKQRAQLAEKRRSLARAEDEASAKEREAKERAETTARQIREVEEQWAARREALTLVWVDSSLLARHGVQRWALTLPETPDGAELATLADRLVELERALVARAEEDEALGAALERARAAESEAERAAADARTKHEAALESERQLQLELQVANQSRITAVSERDAAAAALRGPLADWPDARLALERDPGRLVELVRGAVETLQNARSKERELANRAERRREAHAAAETELRSTHVAFQGVDARWERARARIDGLKAQRAARFDGRPVDVVVRELDDAVRAATHALAEAEKTVSSLQADQAGAEALKARADEAASAAASASRERHEALARALQDSEFERDGLDVILARDPADLEKDRARVAALQARLERAQTTLDDRTRQWSAADLEAPEVEAARSARDAAQAALEAARAQVRELDDRLRRDDEARGRRAELGPEIDATRARLQTAQTMSALIGSADGKKLRTFAQGLTLEALLEQANLHLKRLRPRYELLRVPGQDIDLQVLDRDLGDEVRAIATLSGGETFLVSLALALGLSGLSSRDVRVESMFIDEGFGHLDRDSLDLALATLDELQADGRTIGIVSHVPDLADRIGFVVDVRPVGPGRSRVEVRTL